MARPLRLQIVSTAQISGNVTDLTGAAAAGAQVTVAQTETGFSRTATTNETGFYVLANLPIGPYRLHAVAVEPIAVWNSK